MTKFNQSKNYADSVRVTREALLVAVRPTSSISPAGASIDLPPSFWPIQPPVGKPASHGPYQGWANAQTWCVALYLDNQKYTQDDVLEIVRECLTPDSTGRVFREVCEMEILAYCRMHVRHIREMAPWVWVTEDCDRPVTLTESVSWAEIRVHYEEKLREQR